MRHYSFATLEPSLRASSILPALEAALQAAAPHEGRRVRAAADSRSPEEGLALLDAYLAIADRDVRQAILDVVLAIAAGQRRDVDVQCEPPVSAGAGRNAKAIARSRLTRA